MMKLKKFFVLFMLLLSVGMLTACGSDNKKQKTEAPTEAETTKKEPTPTEAAKEEPTPTPTEAAKPGIDSAVLQGTWSGTKSILLEEALKMAPEDAADDMAGMQEVIEEFFSIVEMHPTIYIDCAFTFRGDSDVTLETRIDMSEFVECCRTMFTDEQLLLKILAVDFGMSASELADAFAAEGVDPRGLIPAEFFEMLDELDSSYGDPNVEEAKYEIANGRINITGEDSMLLVYDGKDALTAVMDEESDDTAFLYYNGVTLRKNP